MTVNQSFVDFAAWDFGVKSHLVKSQSQQNLPFFEVYTLIRKKKKIPDVPLRNASREIRFLMSQTIQLNEKDQLIFSMIEMTLLANEICRFFLSRLSARSFNSFVHSFALCDSVEPPRHVSTAYLYIR